MRPGSGAVSVVEARLPHRRDQGLSVSVGSHPSGNDPRRARIGEPVYRFAPGASLLFVDGLPLLFSAAEQKLLRLDRLAGYVACRCDVGVRADELVRDLVDRGLPSDEAAACVERLVREWSRHRLLTVTFASDDTGLVAERSVRLAHFEAHIRCFDADLDELVGAAFAGIEQAPRSPAATYDVHRSGQLAFITPVGKSSAVIPVEGAVPALKACLTQDLLADIGERLALHAACLLRQGRALLLCGAPGEGKTTLALQLASSGFALAGDDITLLDDRGRVEGVPFPAAVKTGAWKLIEPLRPDFADAAVHVRVDGKHVRYLATDRGTHVGPAHAGCIVILRRRRGALAHVTPVEPTDVLARLLGEAAAPSASLSLPMLRSIVAAIGHARCVELHYDAPAEAADLLTQLFDDAAG